MFNRTIYYGPKQMAMCHVGVLKYNLPLLRRYQRALQSMVEGPNEQRLAFRMIGAHLTEQEADERMYRAGFKYLYYPMTDAELVLFAIEAAGWAGAPNTF
jgi:hypothetical protein